MRYITKIVLLLLLLQYCQSSASACDDIKDWNISTFLNWWHNNPQIISARGNLEKNMEKVISRNKVLRHMHGLKCFYIYEMYHDSGFYLHKKQYQNYSFLKHLNCDYEYTGRFTNKEKKYIRAEILVTDSLGNMLGYGGRGWISINRDHYYSKLIKLLNTGEVDMMFQLFPNKSGGIYIFIKNKKLYVIDEDHGEWVCSTWEQYIREHENFNLCFPDCISISGDITKNISE